MEDLRYVRLLSPNQKLAEWWQEVKEKYEVEFWRDTERELSRVY